LLNFTDTIVGKWPNLESLKIVSDFNPKYVMIYIHFINILFRISLQVMNKIFINVDSTYIKGDIPRT